MVMASSVLGLSTQMLVENWSKEVALGRAADHNFFMLIIS
jgi:hypothetical protein